jgi:thioredoxin-related protein
MTKYIPGMRSRAGKARDAAFDWSALWIAVLCVLLLASLGALAMCLYRYKQRVEQFDNYRGKEHVLYVFLMDGCSWCERFKPELAVLKKNGGDAFAQHVDVRVVSFPAASSEDERLFNDFSVQSFPTFVLSTNDQSKFWIYHNASERTAEAIKQWAVKLVSP